MFLLSPFIFEKYFKKGKARGGGRGLGVGSHPMLYKHCLNLLRQSRLFFTTRSIKGALSR